MTTIPPAIHFADAEDRDLSTVEGAVVVFADGEGALLGPAAALDAAMGGALTRVVEDKRWKPKAGTAQVLAFPAGLTATRVLLACLGPDPDRAAARKTGGAIAKALRKGQVTLAVSGAAEAAVMAETLFTMALRVYDFTEYKSKKSADDENGTDDEGWSVTVVSDAPEALAKASEPFAALAEGIYFTRDLVNEPANRLTTDEFAARLAAMQEIGIDVEIHGEEALAEMGARAILAVGQGSESESKLVTMKWMGGPEGQAPLVYVGKGVVFDTGGISLKPAGGMEDMTMDMGGAGVVAGVMRALALRKASANVIGVVGLVENMPDGRAQRPGDVIKSMKGDTIEVINTDAEGRLVLADALWYAQETFNPRAMVDLATLTGAMVVALGHHRAGFFATDDDFAARFAEVSETVGDAAWRLPLGTPYANQIKSPIADIKNTGGRGAGSITAAEFLHRFVKNDCPWIHIDIAGVTTTSAGTDTAPKGATGWGVAALDELARQMLES